MESGGARQERARLIGVVIVVLAIAVAYLAVRSVRRENDLRCQLKKTEWAARTNAEGDNERQLNLLHFADEIRARVRAGQPVTDDFIGFALDKARNQAKEESASTYTSRPVC